MASIYKRKDTKKTSYLLMIRRKGVPFLFLTFKTEKEARKWAIDHEDAYVSDPKKYSEWLRQKRVAAKNVNGWSPYDI